MAHAVPAVVGKREREDGLAGVLDRVGEAGDEVDDVRAVEGAREEEVAEREAVEDCVERVSSGRGVV